MDIPCTKTTFDLGTNMCQQAGTCVKNALIMQKMCSLLIKVGRYVNNGTYVHQKWCIRVINNGMYAYKQG